MIGTKKRKIKMKKEVFNKYVNMVSRAFQIDATDIFMKTKQRQVVEARHMLYYLSFHRPMSKVEIQRYMMDYGYPIGHSSIIYGIEQADEKVRHDRDYFKLVKDISEL